jgi:uncharacterized membrane-anchored protein YhcB (DUF1043 family)
MLIDQDKELKQAILNLPAAEKDKLLLKLISKDVVLLNKLHHQLLDGAESLDEKRGLVLKAISQHAEHIKNMMQNYPGFLTPGQLMMELRDMSGLVNEHVLITKDKLADIELRIEIIAEAYKIGSDLLKEVTRRNEKLSRYLAARAKYIIQKYDKLHEDHQFDLKNKLNKVLSCIHHSSAQLFASELLVPKEV